MFRLLIDALQGGRVEFLMEIWRKVIDFQRAFWRIARRACRIFDGRILMEIWRKVIDFQRAFLTHCKEGVSNFWWSNSDGNLTQNDRFFASFSTHWKEGVSNLWEWDFDEKMTEMLDFSRAFWRIARRACWIFDGRILMEIWRKVIDFSPTFWRIGRRACRILAHSVIFRKRSKDAPDRRFRAGILTPLWRIQFFFENGQKRHRPFNWRWSRRLSWKRYSTLPSRSRQTLSYLKIGVRAPIAPFYA